MSALFDVSRWSERAREHVRRHGFAPDIAANAVQNALVTLAEKSREPGFMPPLDPKTYLFTRAVQEAHALVRAERTDGATSSSVGGPRAPLSVSLDAAAGVTATELTGREGACRVTPSDARISNNLECCAPSQLFHPSGDACATAFGEVELPVPSDEVTRKVRRANVPGDAVVVKLLTAWHRARWLCDEGVFAERAGALVDAARVRAYVGEERWEQATRRAAHLQRLIGEARHSICMFFSGWRRAEADDLTQITLVRALTRIDRLALCSDEQVEHFLRGCARRVRQEASKKSLSVGMRSREAPPRLPEGQGSLDEWMSAEGLRQEIALPPVPEVLVAAKEEQIEEDEIRAEVWARLPEKPRRVLDEDLAKAGGEATEPTEAESPAPARRAQSSQKRMERLRARALLRDLTVEVRRERAMRAAGRPQRAPTRHPPCLRPPRPLDWAHRRA